MAIDRLCDDIWIAAAHATATMASAAVFDGTVAYEIAGITVTINTIMAIIITIHDGQQLDKIINDARLQRQQQQSYHQQQQQLAIVFYRRDIIYHRLQLAHQSLNNHDNMSISINVNINRKITTKIHISFAKTKAQTIPLQFELSIKFQTNCFCFRLACPSFLFHLCFLASFLPSFLVSIHRFIDSLIHSFIHSIESIERPIPTFDRAVCFEQSTRISWSFDTFDNIAFSFQTALIWHAMDIIDLLARNSRQPFDMWMQCVCDWWRLNFFGACRKFESIVSAQRTIWRGERVDGDGVGRWRTESSNNCWIFWQTENYKFVKDEKFGYFNIYCCVLFRTIFNGVSIMLLTGMSIMYF